MQVRSITHGVLWYLVCALPVAVTGVVFAGIAALLIRKQKNKRQGTDLNGPDFNRVPQICSFSFYKISK
jgi:hypothetical protein